MLLQILSLLIDFSAQFLTRLTNLLFGSLLDLLIDEVLGQREVNERLTVWLQFLVQRRIIILRELLASIEDVLKLREELIVISSIHNVGHRGHSKWLLIVLIALYLCFLSLA